MNHDLEISARGRLTLDAAAVGCFAQVMSNTENQPVLDRHGLEVLSTDQCWELLRKSPIGRVAFVHDGEPVILPVGFVVAEHHLAFRSARGAKLGAATMNRPVAFEVDGWSLETGVGWSVLVEGTASLILDAEEEAELEHLPLTKWTPQSLETEWVRILPNDISGRRTTIRE